MVSTELMAAMEQMVIICVIFFIHILSKLFFSLKYIFLIGKSGAPGPPGPTGPIGPRGENSFFNRLYSINLLFFIVKV